MSKFHDQMNLETKQKLQDACIAIMLEHGIQGVTVQGLTTKTGLNRGTFYLHYLDKYDLMAQIQERLLTGLETCLSDMEPLEGLGFIEMGKPYPPIIQMFTYFSSESTAFKVLLGPTGDPAFSKKIKNLYKKTILKKVLSHLPKERTKDDQYDELILVKNYFISFITAAIFGVIEEWLANGAKETPEEMGMIQYQIVRTIRFELGK